MEAELEFKRNSFAKCNNFRKVSLKTKKDTQVIRVREEGCNRITCFTVLRSILKIKLREALDRIEQEPSLVFDRYVVSLLVFLPVSRIINYIIQNCPEYAGNLSNK